MVLATQPLNGIYSVPAYQGLQMLKRHEVHIMIGIKYLRYHHTVKFQTISGRTVVDGPPTKF